MIVLCLDPSFRHFGYSVFDYRPQNLITIRSFGVIEVPKVASKVGGLTAREVADMEVISEHLCSLCELWKPDLVLAELPAGTQSARAARLLGAVTGLVVGLCHAKVVPVIWHGARTVKKWVIGDSCATKDQIMGWARWRFKGVDFPQEKGKFEHIADSIALFYANFRLETSYPPLKID